MTEFEEGRVVGSYRVVRLIGQGGMGLVYEVEHVELGVRYALKTFTFPEDAAHAEVLRQKFFEEGKVLARLKGPHLVHVFDLAIDEETGTPYFVMDLVTYEDGQPYALSDLLDAEIDEELVFDWFKDACETLDYVHGEGIVHRDIKPSNLMLDAEQHVVLADFGVSKIFGSGLQADVMRGQTKVGDSERENLVMGTEGFMAPEVERGEQATPAADRYSLGMTFLVLLNGGAKFDSVSAALAHLAKTPRKFRWSAVLPQLLAQDPARRPQKLTPILRSLDPRVLRREAQEKLEKARNRRNRKIAVFGLVATVLVALGGLGVTWFVHERGRRQLEERERIAAREKAAFEEKIAKLNDQQKENLRKLKGGNPEEVKRKISEALAEAERKRLDAEKAKRDADRKADEERKRKEAAEREKRNAAADAKKTESASGRTFIEETPAVEKPGLGAIPDKKYAWLANGDRKSPLNQTFQLANGAKLELIAFAPQEFNMRNQPDEPKGWHKVTVTRPFWMTKTCVTVDQWREFAPYDCEDCREVEKALNERAAGHRALLYFRRNRRECDSFCKKLTEKYATQLPKGYVFRLPTEAERQLAMDADGTMAKYNQPRVKGWRDFVGLGSGIAQKNFREIKNGHAGAVLKKINDGGDWPDTCYWVGGLANPNSKGFLDIFANPHWVLDIAPRNGQFAFADCETDPLHWVEGGLYDDGRASGATSDWEVWRSCRRFTDRCLFNVVLGPDLVSEKAWDNERRNRDATAKLPVQRSVFDPKKIRSKITKPREVVLNRVGGKKMTFCEIPKARFTMTNVNGQDKAYHKVELTRPFWMSKHLVTADEWREYASDDFDTPVMKMVEQKFMRYPIAVRNSYARWTAYCEFLTRRYAAILPPGYVFRLPTEAEWEWAFIADEKGDARRMSGELCNGHGPVRSEMESLFKRVQLPNWVDRDSQGFVWEAFVGGRTRPTTFGVFDMVCHNGGDVITLDTFDSQCFVREDGREDDRFADAAKTIVYEDRESDPVRYAGKCSRWVLRRSMGAGRALSGRRAECYAHIVIAPDLLKPLKAREIVEFPKEDFKGVYLGDGVTRADQSSRCDGDRRNSEKQFRRLVSRENVIVANKDKREDTRGFHTDREDAPWILLDFGKRRTVTGLAIDAFGGRTKQLCVWASDDGKRERLVDSEPLERQRYRIDLNGKNVTCRYLRIGRRPNAQKNEPFYLDKVVIYGK